MCYNVAHLKGTPPFYSLWVQQLIMKHTFCKNDTKHTEAFITYSPDLFGTFEGSDERPITGITDEPLVNPSADAAEKCACHHPRCRIIQDEIVLKFNLSTFLRFWQN